jgi:hypothetical protein
VSTDDRAYLARLTASVTGLSAPDAEKRVDTVIGQARENIRKARRSGVILAFMAGAAALVGAAVAWFAACAGGEHRDGKSAPLYDMGICAVHARSAVEPLLVDVPEAAPHGLAFHCRTILSND